MNVFKGITPVVIVAVVGLAVVFGAGQAWAGWLYPVDAPQPARINKRKVLHNPTLAEIQRAIKPRTRIDIIGTVDASNGGFLDVNEHDVRLNFKRASQVKWTGGDTWNGLIEISGQRIEVRGLKLMAAGSGRCRGIVIHTPASDVRISGCTVSGAADAFVADGQWQRIAIEHCRFLNCADWNNTSMDGGYGMYIEEDDHDADHLRISDVRVTLSGGSAQHGLRISKVQDIVIENSRIGANDKRSLWVYGAERVSIRNSAFTTGSVLFNLKPDEWMADRPTRHVRMWNCTIDHDSILLPLGIYCGKGMSDFRLKDCQINSTQADAWMEVSWRETGGPPSRNIRWLDGSVTFNGEVVNGFESCIIGSEWADGDLKRLKIGPAKTL
jgi:hypothetical protein